MHIDRCLSPDNPDIQLIVFLGRTQPWQIGWFCASVRSLDEIDQTIVQILVEDGRISIPMLAEQAGISRATAYVRFDRLVERGVITGFGARVDPTAIGLGVAASITLTADQGEWATLKQRILTTTGVQWVGLGAGSFDFTVLVRAGDLAELRDVVLKELLSLPGIRSTQTTVLLDEARPGGAVL